MVHMQLPGDGAGPPLLDVVIAQDLRLEVRGNSHAWLLRGHTGQRFEDPGGGAENLDGRIAGSRSRTSGSVLAAALANRRWMAVCLPPPGPVTANHPAALEVNPDASRFFAVPGNGGRATHGRSGRGGLSGSAALPRVGLGAGPRGRSLQRSRSGPGRSSCR